MYNINHIEWSLPNILDELEKCKISSSSNIRRIQNSSKQIIDREKKMSMDKVNYI